MCFEQNIFIKPRINQEQQLVPYIVALIDILERVPGKNLMFLYLFSKS